MANRIPEPNETLAVQLAPQNSRALAPSYLAPAPIQDFEPEDGTVPLSHYLWIVRRHMWKILLFVATCVIATFLVSSRLKPVFEATATINVDRNAPSGVMGEEANTRGAFFDNDQFITTQVRMIQSDSVLRPVTLRHKLLEREGRTENLTPEKRAAIERAPVTLTKLRVTRPPNTYLIQVAYRSPDPDLAANVANGIARSYLEHTYTMQTSMNKTAEDFMVNQMDELKAKVERSSSALQVVETQLGMVNPEDKSSVLSARLLQLNTEYTNAQGDRVRREAVFNATRGGTIESAQNSEQGKDLIRLDERLKEARQRLAEIKTTYGANHPEYRKASTTVTELQRQFEEARKNIIDRVEVDYKQSLNREQMLQKAVAETKVEFDRLSSRSVEYQRLKREADADRKLYDELLKKIRERGINAGFQNNHTRLADEARAPAIPVFPNIPLNLLLAFILSTFLGVGAAIMADVLDTTIRDPEQAARFLRTDVVGTLPAVKNPAGIALLALSPSSEATEGGGLVKFNEKSGYGYGYKSITSYEEAIRTLRNTILLADIERNIRSLLVTSASPGEGKSTTAIHLAIAHAQQNKKTLIIDADLRRPTVHKKLGLPTAGVGLSTVLMG